MIDDQERTKARMKDLLEPPTRSVPNSTDSADNPQDALDYFIQLSDAISNNQLEAASSALSHINIYAKSYSIQDFPQFLEYNIPNLLYTILTEAPTTAVIKAINLIKTLFCQQQSNVLSFLYEKSFLMVYQRLMNTNVNCVIPVLKLISNMSGYSKEGKKAAMQIFPLDLMQMNMSSSEDPKVLYLTAHILYNYSRYKTKKEVQCKYILEIINSTWKKHESTIRWFYLWSIYEINNYYFYLADDLLNDGYTFKQLIQESLFDQTENMIISVNILFNIIIERYPDYQFDYLQFMYMLQNSDSKSVIVGCWALQQIIEQKSIIQELLSHQIFSIISESFQHSSFEAKTELIMLQSTLINSNIPHIVQFALEQSIISDLLDNIQSNYNGDVILLIIEAIKCIFTRSYTHNLFDACKSQFLEAEGDSIFQELTFVDDEDVAEEATDFLSRYIDQ